MKIYDGYHEMHYKALLMKRIAGKEGSFINSTQKMHIFRNGHGAGIINFGKYTRDRVEWAEMFNEV